MTMTRTVVIHQPDFLPHLAFFHRLLCADLFVLLDTAQYVTGTSKSWMNRDKIKTRNGAKWITVPVRKAHRGARMMDIALLTTDDWRTDSVNQIIQNYKEAPFFDEAFPSIEDLYRYKCEKLLDFNLRSITMLMDLLDIKIETKLTSSLNPKGKGNDLLVDILKKVNATTYLSGIGAKDYYEPEPFQKAGIDVIWQDFKHPTYPQLYGDFIPYLSSIDLLFNCGLVRSKEILYNLQKETLYSPLKGIHS
jgi:hypothetical protein